MRLAGAALSAGFLLLAGTILIQARAQAQDRGVMNMSVAQSDFTENCGGCHGFDGDSAPADIPVLKDRVGYFMCSKEGREYLIRLPNVAHSRITDPQELADLMNFVVFAIGAHSTPKDAKPFKAAEVAALRKQAMTTISLIDERARVVQGLPASCNAPATLDKFYPSQSGPNHIDVPSAIP
jgi:hypothetical protein